MKIRIYTPFFPFTMTEGAFQVISDQVFTLVKLKHQVEMVIVREDRASVFEKMRLMGWDTHRTDFKIVFFENAAPAETRAQPRLESAGNSGSAHLPGSGSGSAYGPNRNPLAGAAFRRAANLEDPSEESDFEGSPKALPDNRWKRVVTSLFSGLASPELLYYPPQNDHRDMLGAVDLAIYHYSFAYAWLINPSAPQESKKVVYFHNLESDLFRQRAVETRNIFNKLVFYLNAWKLRRHEKKLAQLCSEVWLISPPDQKQYLQNNLTAVTRLISPSFNAELKTARTERFLRDQNAMDENSATSPPSENSVPADRPVGHQGESSTPLVRSNFSGVTLGYLGGMDFGPNRESALWILSHLAPELLKKNFTGRILIAGKNPPPEVLRLAKNFPFFEVLGFLKNTEDFWCRLSWMLVPHINGSGVRMKLLEAVASGVPVLAHPSAIERLHPALQNHLGIVACSTLEDWSQMILAETPFQTRRKLQEKLATSEVVAGLDGLDIYRFLE